MNNILSFDIEDNFTREELADPRDWEKYEGQVVENTERILRLLDEYDTKATFFVLGKVASRRPEVVQMIGKAGHEVASHGYIHEWVDRLGEDGFKEDVRKSKAAIESITGQPMAGFRAMAFSLNDRHAWALDFLRQQGFRYDSSILSSRLCRYKSGGKLSGSLDAGLREMPVSSTRIAGRDVTIGGGLFFRLAPYFLIRSVVKRRNAVGEPVLFYAHAWEFNRDQPKRKVSRLQALAQSPATYTTPKRIRKLLDEFSFTSIAGYLGA